MFDKILNVNNYKIFLKKINKTINIKVISDLHLCESFNNKKLDIIKNKILLTKTDYLFICGDIIDSTSFLYKNIKLKEKYINWFKEIAKKVPIYIILGNHDYILSKKEKNKKDINNDFFDILSNIPNIYLSLKNNYYETNDLIVLMVENKLSYYYINDYSEKQLIKELIKNKKYLDIKSDKLKILLIHSPVNMTNKNVLELTKNYDIILSGHMHNGAIPFNLSKILPGNKGLISPNKKLFPSNVRGMIKTKIYDKNQYLIISGGITKLQECSGILKIFNILFTMDMENIIINGN